MTTRFSNCDVMKNIANGSVFALGERVTIHSCRTSAIAIALRSCKR